MERKLLQLRELLVTRGLSKDQEKELARIIKKEARINSRSIHLYGGHIRYLDEDSPFYVEKLQNPFFVRVNGSIPFPDFLTNGNNGPTEQDLLYAILYESFSEWEHFFNRLDNLYNDVIFDYGDKYCSEILESFFSLWRWIKVGGYALYEFLELKGGYPSETATEFMVDLHNTRDAKETMEYISREFNFYPIENNALVFGSEISTSTSTLNTNKKENNNMFNFGNMFNTNINLAKVRVTMLGMGIETENNEVLIYNEEEGTLTDATDFAMDIGQNMVFAFPSQSVKVGDLVVNGKKIVFVTAVNGNSLQCIDYETEQSVRIIKKKHPMFGHFVQKIICPMGNMFSGLGSGEGENGFMKMMMFSSMMGNSSDSQNPFGGNNMIQMMMMSQLFGNKEGDSPFENMFNF